MVPQSPGSQNNQRVKAFSNESRHRVTAYLPLYLKIYPICARGENLQANPP